LTESVTDTRTDGGAENAGVENAGTTKYGKPSAENTLKYQTKYGYRGFPHPNLFVFLAILPSTVCQMSAELPAVWPCIRRAKKRVNLTNDKRIKMCLQRFDSHA